MEDTLQNVLKAKSSWTNYGRITSY